MTELLFREDAYLQEAEARVTGLTTEGGIILDRTIFFPTGGGQPGDSGRLDWPFGNESEGVAIATTLKGEGNDVILVPSEPARLPPVGTIVIQRLDWMRRHRHMRLHTALHLLSVVLPYPVTGGAIGSDKGRLDFKMLEPIDEKQALEEALNSMIERDLVVSEVWISDEALIANPSLVKTMSVMPPMGQGRVRLVQIGQGAEQVDLQPCGGTHVARTSEIGRIRFGKIENKGRDNRRVAIHLD